MFFMNTSYWLRWASSVMTMRLEQSEVSRYLTSSRF